MYPEPSHSASSISFVSLLSLPDFSLQFMKALSEWLFLSSSYGLSDGNNLIRYYLKLFGTGYTRTPYQSAFLCLFVPFYSWPGSVQVSSTSMQRSNVRRKEQLVPSFHMISLRQAKLKFCPKSEGRSGHGPLLANRNLTFWRT